jgi:glycosyltransferase involved in cell wall biosynthesis
MRILAVDQYREIGGAQSVFLSTLECLTQRGVSVTAAVPAGGGVAAAIDSRFRGAVKRVDVAEPDLTPGHKTPRDALNLARHGVGMLRLRPLLADFDYVYVNGPRLFPSFLVLSTLAATRFVYHVHLDHSAIEKAIIAGVLCHPRTHAVLANSAFVRSRLRRGLGPVAREDRLRLLENSLSAELSSLAFVERWRETAPLRAVVIGRLLPEKGQDLVVELASQNPDVRFHVLGGDDRGRPDFARDLRSRAGRNVTFHGHVADVPATIAELGAQINLVPSRREESFGLAAIEGMACSCLTITSGRGALRDISTDTGAWIASTVGEWQAAIVRIRQASRTELTRETESQYRRTLLRYGFERFARDSAGIFT